ncbi:MAG: DUF4239 domain-containing protein [Planctomycetia bacterium]|nr:DUF4239 domain-containing protein [Planctomycetia bacterium]
MNSLATAAVVFGCAFAAALAAMRVARRLPEHHLSSESRDVVKLGLGIIATLTALVLGLLVASAKATYDSQDGAVKQLATNVSLLDRFLAHYGPETNELRELLRQIVTITVERIWPDSNARTGDLSLGATRDTADLFYSKVAELQPRTEAQRAVKARAMDLTSEMAQTRFRMYSQKESSVPIPFLVVLVFWLMTLFAGYGLLAPRNPTVVAVLLVCALSMSAAVFLVLELGRPFAGIIHVSSAPIQEALSQIGK